mmetsp:Transcript_13459/g.31669  ORF Transcript_13459/g.31669 Transcript_13459/m.31669 type:complete len:639 (-) Transcript_13459:482-2398(-)
MIVVTRHTIASRFYEQWCAPKRIRPSSFRGRAKPRPFAIDGSAPARNVVRSSSQTEPAPQKDPRVPHAMNENRRPQVLGLGVDDGPGPSQNAEWQKGQLALVVDGKQDAADEVRQVVPLGAELQHQSRQQESPVQDFLPPRGRQAGSDVTDQRGDDIGPLRVDELGHDRVFLGLFQNSHREDVRVAKIGHVEEPRADKVPADGPPDPLRMPRLLRGIFQELSRRDCLFVVVASAGVIVRFRHHLELLVGVGAIPALEPLRDGFLEKGLRPGNPSQDETSYGDPGEVAQQDGEAPMHRDGHPGPVPRHFIELVLPEQAEPARKKVGPGEGHQGQERGEPRVVRLPDVLPGHVFGIGSRPQIRQKGSIDRSRGSFRRGGCHHGCCRASVGRIRINGGSIDRNRFGCFGGFFDFQIKEVGRPAPQVLVKRKGAHAGESVEADRLKIPPVVRKHLKRKYERLLRKDRRVEEVQDEGHRQLGRRPQVKEPRGQNPRKTGGFRQPPGLSQIQRSPFLPCHETGPDISNDRVGIIGRGNCRSCSSGIAVSIVVVVLSGHSDASGKSSAAAAASVCVLRTSSSRPSPQSICMNRSRFYPPRDRRRRPVGPMVHPPAVCIRATDTRIGCRVPVRERRPVRRMQRGLG